MVLAQQVGEARPRFGSLELVNGNPAVSPALVMM
jgi:hypothetical protein